MVAYRHGGSTGQVSRIQLQETETRRKETTKRLEIVPWDLGAEAGVLHLLCGTSHNFPIC